MTELKPCPFCGSEDLECEDKKHIAAIYCDCDAMMGYFDTIEEAIAAWNRRVGAG